MSMDMMAIGAARKYTEESLTGAGALKGSDGVSITDVEVNANNQVIITFSDGSTTTAGAIKTVKGEKGTDGKSGKDGYTPIREIDYWTEEDKIEIKQYVDNQIGGALNGTY